MELEMGKKQKRLNEKNDRHASYFLNEVKENVSVMSRHVECNLAVE